VSVRVGVGTDTEISSTSTQMQAHKCKHTCQDLSYSPQPPAAGEWSRLTQLPLCTSSTRIARCLCERMHKAMRNSLPLHCTLSWRVQPARQREGVGSLFPCPSPAATERPSPINVFYRCASVQSLNIRSSCRSWGPTLRKISPSLRRPT